jgi:hypothetical protein
MLPDTPVSSVVATTVCPYALAHALSRAEGIPVVHGGKDVKY